jgi:hypothetical protein
MSKHTKHHFLPKDYLFCGSGHSNDVLVQVICGRVAIVIQNPLFGSETPPKSNINSVFMTQTNQMGAENFKHKKTLPKKQKHIHLSKEDKEGIEFYKGLLNFKSLK